MVLLSEIGRQLDTSFLSPFLWIRTVFDSRQVSGMWFSRCTELKIDVKIYANLSNFFQTAYLTRSGPGAVLFVR